MSKGIIRKHSKVIIVGAGAAGITAAIEFLDAGLDDITIVEARDRIGGRVQTDGEFGDLGASWLHIPIDFINDSNSNQDEVKEILEDLTNLDIINFARKNGFELIPEDETIAAFFNNQTISEQRVYNEINKLSKRIETKLNQLENPKINKHSVKDSSISEVLRPIIQKNEFRRFIAETEFGGAEHGQELSKVSLLDLGDIFLRSSGLLCKQGLGNLIHEYGSRCHHLIELNKRVESFNVMPNLVRISGSDTVTNQRFLYTAERAIITLPIGVLQCDKKDFKITHNLSIEKRMAISKIRMGTFNKVILKMDEKFFLKFGIEENSQIHIHHDKIKTDFAMMARPAGKNLIVAFIGGNDSMEFEKKGEEFAINQVLNSLESAYGPNIRSYFEKGHFTNWNNDIYSRGSYSATEIDFADARKILNTPERDTLWMAGEACYSNGWQTHLIGAMLTGQNAADAILKKLNKDIGVGIAS